ncbi:hypothetical protein CRUP_026112 [Coryphaenoides rupestris]|nr:hypothetical protein CRUP_026112 [Coryphaenoides rupestris]
MLGLDPSPESSPAEVVSAVDQPALQVLQLDMCFHRLILWQSSAQPAARSSPACRGFLSPGVSTTATDARVSCWVLSALEGNTTPRPAPAGPSEALSSPPHLSLLQWGRRQFVNFDSPRLTATQCVEGMATGLYEELFTAIVSLINRALSTQQLTLASVAVVDTPGLRNPRHAGEEPEVVSAVDQPALQVRAADGVPRGLLWLLDEELVTPGSTENAALERVCQYYSNTVRQCEQPLQCEVSHMLGLDPVRYDLTGWFGLIQNNPSSLNAVTLLQNSTALFSPRSLVPPLCQGLGGFEGSSQRSLQRSGTIRKTFSGGMAAVRRHSAAIAVKLQACVKAQTDAGGLDMRALRAQLQSTQILSALQLYRTGYPEHMLLGDFRCRFQALSPVIVKRYASVFVAHDERKAVEELRQFVNFDSAQAASSVLGSEGDDLHTAVFKHHLRQLLQRATGGSRDRFPATDTENVVVTEVLVVVEVMVVVMLEVLMVVVMGVLVVVMEVLVVVMEVLVVVVMEVLVVVVIEVLVVVVMEVLVVVVMEVLVVVVMEALVVVVIEVLVVVIEVLVVVVMEVLVVVVIEVLVVVVIEVLVVVIEVLVVVVMEVLVVVIEVLVVVVMEVLVVVVMEVLVVLVVVVVVMPARTCQIAFCSAAEMPSVSMATTNLLKATDARCFSSTCGQDDRLLCVSGGLAGPAAAHRAYTLVPRVPTMDTYILFTRAARAGGASHTHSPRRDLGV